MDANHSDSRRQREAKAHQIVERYASQLLILVSTKLNRRLRPRLSARDVVQSAFRSFFARGLDQRAPEEIEDLLVVIAVRKAIDAAHYHWRGKRSVLREQPLGSGEGIDDYPPEFLESLKSGPSPDEIAAGREAVENLLERLSEQERVIVTLESEGFSQKEIATRLETTPRTVRRKKAEMRKRMSRELGE